MLEYRKHFLGAYDALPERSKELMREIQMNFLIRNGIKHGDGSMGTMLIPPKQFRDCLAYAATSLHPKDVLIQEEASQYWSAQEHIEQCIEEAGEIVVEGMHLRRDRGTMHDFLAELCDMDIMIDHFKGKFPARMRNLKSEKIQKMERLMRDKSK